MTSLSKSQKPVLVTGAAGFIGFALARRLLENGCAVVGVDCVNDYYDPALKEARLAVLRQFPHFGFHKIDLAERKPTEALFRDGDFGPVVHLAAQAGVRHSLQHPHAYLDSNLSGFLNILEGCRHRNTEHLVFASSSSVYGSNKRMPFSIHDNVDHPISLYAATKKANELMAHSYSHLYGLPTTGLRFFTVYGPWGRPDMAMFIFAKAISEGQPIKLFNYGRMRRDFTYVDDVTEAVGRIIGLVPVKSEAPKLEAPKLEAPKLEAPMSKAPMSDTLLGGDLDPGTSTAPWRIYNIGNNRTVEISRVVELLEQEFGRKAIIELVPMQPGDVPESCADVDDLMRDVGFRPSTPIEQGLHNFAAWYRDYHRK